MRTLATLMIVLLLGPSIALAAEDRVTGTALYRERIALPPNARFEAVIEDTSRADAPASVLGRTTIDMPGQPPIRFEIPFDESAVNPAARYAVRATISVNGKLWFTTDTIVPVISRGDTRDVKLMLKRVRASGAKLPPAPSHPSDRRLLSGAFRYLADAATIEICRTGERVPVAMENAYRDLEIAYGSERPAPGKPLMVTVEGKVTERADMEGPPRPVLVVDRFIAAWPGETCDRNTGDAPLMDTYWRIVQLKGEIVSAVQNRREPHLMFRSREPRRLAATVGCNRLSGGYEVSQTGLTIGRMASTMMACPPPLQDRERKLAETLASVSTYATAAPALVLYDRSREPLIVLQSVFLR